MNVEKRSVAALVPHPKNYRRHPDSQIAVLRDSLRIHGLQKPVVIQADGTILAGHALVEAARAEGWVEIECHVYDGPAEYAEAFLVADNRTNEMAENDWSALADLLQELDDGSRDMLATGYDGAALMELMHGCDEAARRLAPDFREYDENLPDSPAAQAKRVKCPECGHEFDA